DRGGAPAVGSAGEPPAAAGAAAPGDDNPRLLTLRDLPDVLDTRQVCAVLKVSRATWQRWRERRSEPIPELEPRTRRPRYAKADVEAYLRAPKGTAWQRRMAMLAS